MKKILLSSLILLTACSTATGPTYDSANITQTSYIVFYNHTGSGDSQPVNLHYNGKMCKLHNKGFVIIPGQQIELFATSSSSPDVSRLSSATSRTAYVRIDSSSAQDSENHGPYKFRVITDEKQAQEALKDLHQDCL